MTKLAFVASFSFALATGCMTGEPDIDPAEEALVDHDGDAAVLGDEVDDPGRPGLDPSVEARACGFSTDSWGTSRWKNCTSKHVTVRVDVRLSTDVSYCVKPNSTKTIGVAWAARDAAVTLNGCT